MNINNRINTLEKELGELRSQWKTGSSAMKRVVEDQARKKKAEISVLQRVLERRESKNDPKQQELI